MTAPKMDPKHWASTDNRRFTSVPAPEPTEWRRMTNGAGQLVYVSGAYSIVRTVGPNGSRTYVVYRDGIELSLSFTGMLWYAKDRAVKNATGRDVVNVA